MSFLFRVNFRKSSASANPVGWNDCTLDGVTGVGIANLSNWSNSGASSGVQFSILTTPYTASSSGAMTNSSHHGIEEAVYDTYIYATYTFGQLEFLETVAGNWGALGVTIGSTVTVRFVSLTNQDRDITITASGGGSATYDNSVVATPVTPPAPVSFTTTIVDNGDGRARLLLQPSTSNISANIQYIEVFASNPTINVVNGSDKVTHGQVCTWTVSDIVPTSATLNGVSLTSVSSSGFTIPAQIDGNVVPDYGFRACVASNGSTTASRNVNVVPASTKLYVRIRDNTKNVPGNLRFYVPSLGLDDAVTFSKPDQLTPAVTNNNISEDGTIQTDYVGTQSILVRSSSTGIVSFYNIDSAVGTPADLVPDAFTFTDVTSATVNTVYTSDSITVTGTTANENVPISITAGGEYRIYRSGAWTTYASTASSVVSGEQVQVRLTTSSSYETAHNTTLTIGTVSDTYTVTTMVADIVPDQYTFTDITDAGWGVYSVSNSITVTGTSVGANVGISITGGEYSINTSGTWSAYTNTSGTVTLNDQVRVRVLTSTSSQTASNATLTIGGINDTYTATTGTIDLTPDNFDFTDITGADLNVVVTSNTVTIAGIQTGNDSPVTVSGSIQYSKNGGTYTSVAGTVTNDDTITVRLTTDYTYLKTFTGSITVGGFTDTFTVTTKAVPSIPNINLTSCTDNSLPLYTVKYQDGNRPFINSVVGKVERNSQLIISGHFSDKRNGDMFNNSFNRNIGEELAGSYVYQTNVKGFVNPTCAYADTALDSQWVASGNTPILTHDTVSETYYSYMLKVNVVQAGNPGTVWNAATPYQIGDVVRYMSTVYSYIRTYRRLVAGTTATAPELDATNWEDTYEGLQMKMERPCVDVITPSAHAGGTSTTLFWEGDGQQSITSGYSTNDVAGNPGGSLINNEWDSRSGSSTGINQFFNNWIRVYGYYKASTDNGSINNGSVFKAFRNESTKSYQFNALGPVEQGYPNYNDVRIGGSTTPFFEPRYINRSFADDGGFKSPSNEFWLPFFKRNTTELDVYVDALILNDSPESVWLLNSQDINIAMSTGKSVQLPQLSRTQTTITVDVYLADFSANEEIYLVVQNSNGKFSTPYLVREIIS